MLQELTAERHSPLVRHSAVTIRKTVWRALDDADEGTHNF